MTCYVLSLVLLIDFYNNNDRWTYIGYGFLILVHYFGTNAQTQQLTIVIRIDGCKRDELSVDQK